MPKGNKLIPELRFPEFSENWDIISVSDMCDVYRGSTFSKADMDEKGSKPCIHYGELFTKYNEVISAVYSKTNKSDGFKSEVGDILMPSSDVTPDGLAKASAIMLDNVILGGDMNILRPKKSFNSIFISYLLNHSKKEIIKLVSGTTVKHIYPSQIITCQLPFVKNEAEQQKIASCLSSLDEVIEAHGQKLELLKNHKKGLMQNLFPQKGEKVPKYRFAEFEKDEVWMEKSIDSIAKVSTGGTPTSTVSKYWGGNIPWMNSGELNLKKVYSVQNYITDLGLKESSTKKIPPLCVLIGLAGQGKTRGTAAINYIELCTNQSIAAIHPNPKKFDSEFLYFKIDSMYKTLRRLSTGQGGRGGLNLSIIREIKIHLPSIKEQKKIASCLSSLDEIIAAQTEKIEQLKQHKKGLMQGLFPKIEN